MQELKVNFTDVSSIKPRLFVIGALFLFGSINSFELFMTSAVAQPPLVVGTQTIEIQDVQRARNLTSEVWFAAKPGSVVTAFSPLLPIKAIDIAQDSQPVKGAAKKPLIVMSHGNWGTRYSQGWLNKALVEAGYIILSTSHPGTLNADQTVAGRIRLWDRAKDVSAVLDHFLKDPQWAALVDVTRIGFVGHSFGGHTGITLAGARFDLSRQIQACQTMTVKDLYCDGLLSEDHSSVSLLAMQDNFKDDRIKSFYIMASGPAQGFSPESLAQVRAPFFIDTAMLDNVLEPKSNSTALARLLPNAIERKRSVGHFTYVPQCKPIIGKLVAALICTDPPDVDRAAAHESVANDAKEFFQKTL